MKKIISFFICAVLVLSLGACNNNAAPSDSETGDKLSGDIVLSVAYINEDGIKRVIEEYKKKQPNVNVILDAKYGNDYTTWLSTQLASGNPRPDIVTSSYALYNNYADFEEWVFKVNPYTGVRWNEQVDFNTYSRVNSFGEKYCVNTQYAQVMWYYNKDHFAKAGVDSIPKTLDEFLKICEKLKAKDNIPYLAGGLFSHYTWHQWLYELYLDQYTRNFITYAAAQKGDWNYDPDVDGKWSFDVNNPLIDFPANVTYNMARFFKNFKDGAFSFNTPEYREFITKFKQLTSYNHPDYLVGGDEYEVFLRGEVSMFIAGTWELSTLDKDMQKIQDRGIADAFEWGTFPVPGIEGGLTKAPIRNIESGSGEGVGVIRKSQAQVNRCMDFLMFWLSTEGYQHYVDAAIEAETWKPSGSFLIQGITQPEEFSKYYTDMKIGGNAENGLTNIDALIQPSRGENHRRAYDMLIACMQGKITVDEYAQQYQKLCMDSLASTVEAVGLTMDDVEYPQRQPK